MSRPAARSTATGGGGRVAGIAGRSVILALGVFFALLPFVWMVRTAFGPSQSAFQLTSNPIPQSVSFDAFQRAWADGGLGRALLTGIGVSLAILALQLVTAIPAAYVFAWLPFRGRSVVFAVVLATLLVPSQVTAIPNYVTISALGLSNTRVGLVLPFMTSAASIFLLRQYMTTIPVSVLEAARMDGLGVLRTLRTIVVPLSAPAIATVSVFSFLLSFNEYLWPLLEARSPDIATPPLALATMFASPKYGLPDFAELAAGALVISLPTLVVFFIAQRRLTSGLTGTGVGG
ncbi:carbohydrate ABC transporter permease [Frankia sp. AgB1.9]|uniref:carbohydrate ABC transporter permease n=1 Tax=unclassified Frankia TaxID=2632575 RepID=UPI0019322396|nr:MULTISPECIES: carbohydrate ABC transporter permease [unclassified Frankia]MBL7491297.1 carbohydrate ABC transporter permease [Frankia sp. AgW1.1]MBL7551590.1 carbohydrate ABC transporter permease [Frankia sp. AgB1.9]MBL7621703.1 carbohydrate ABC transporter permease [Frankia sp. AgB1.8]